MALKRSIFSIVVLGLYAIAYAGFAIEFFKTAKVDFYTANN